LKDPQAFDKRVERGDQSESFLPLLASEEGNVPGPKFDYNTIKWEKRTVPRMETFLRKFKEIPPRRIAESPRAHGASKRKTTRGCLLQGFCAREYFLGLR